MKLILRAASSTLLIFGAVLCILISTADATAPVAQTTTEAAPAHGSGLVRSDARPGG